MIIEEQVCGLCKKVYKESHYEGYCCGLCEKLAKENDGILEEFYAEWKEELLNEGVKGFTVLHYEKTADEYYQKIVKDYPDMLYFKDGTAQYFAINQQAKDYLKSTFINQREELVEKIRYIDDVVLKQLEN